MKKKILYIGRFGFPEDAAGIRVFRIAKLMKRKGYDVSFLRLSVPQREPEHDVISGFQYTQLRRSSSRVVNWLDLLTGCFTICRVKSFVQKNNPDVIVLYNDCGFLTRYMLKYCRKRNILLGADVTEWYEQNHGTFADQYYAKIADYRMRKLDRKLDFVIPISPYLADYYQNQGPAVFEIPPLMDSVSFKHGKRYQYPDGSRLNLSYAGSPGQKDQLKELIHAIEEINQNEILVHLDLIGVDQRYVSERLSSLRYENSGIMAYGRLPHAQTLELLHRADFTVLFRENLRYAKAGFSTKFAESLSLGIPIICNRVGGADELLVNSEAGILLEDAEEKTIYRAIKELTQKDNLYFEKASIAASHLAQDKFLPDVYL